MEGTVLAGKYRLESLLGKGGMGSVWRAQHLELRAPVAVKLMEFGSAPDQGLLVRFQHEATAAASLRGPHVVQILDCGVDQATSAPFIVMELLEGEPLSKRLATLGRLSAADTARVVMQVGRALERTRLASFIVTSSRTTSSWFTTPMTRSSRCWTSALPRARHRSGPVPRLVPAP